MASISAPIGLGLSDDAVRPSDGYVTAYVPTTTDDLTVQTNAWRFGLQPHVTNYSTLGSPGYARCDLVKDGYISGAKSSYGSVEQGLKIDISRPDWHLQIPDQSASFTAAPPTAYNADGSVNSQLSMPTDLWKSLEVSWGGIHPYALRTAIFIWNVPIVLLNPARIQSAVKDNPVLSVSVNGRYMYVSFEKPAPIDAGGGLGIAIGAGAVGHRTMHYVKDSLDPITITSAAGTKTRDFTPALPNPWGYTTKVAKTGPVKLIAPDGLFLGARQMHVYGVPTQGVLEQVHGTTGITYKQRSGRTFYTAVMVCNGDFIAAAVCVWPMCMVRCYWTMRQITQTDAPAWAVSLRLTGTTTPQSSLSLSQRIWFNPNRIHVEEASFITTRTIETASLTAGRSDWRRPSTQSPSSENTYKPSRIGFICTVLGKLSREIARNTQYQADTVAFNLATGALDTSVVRTADVSDFDSAEPGEEVWIQVQGLAGPKVRIKTTLVDKPAVPGQLGWFKLWSTTPDVNQEVGTTGVWVELASALSGGAAPTPTIIGVVLGGNANPIRPPTGDQGKENYTVPSTEKDTEPDELGYVDTDYPVTRPYAFPLPPQSKDNVAWTLPRVNRWDRYRLPLTYKFGDKLPRLPDGLCWVRLTRPYEWGGKTWRANIDSPEEYTPGVNQPVKASIKDGNLVVVFSDASTDWKNFGDTVGLTTLNVPPASAFKLKKRLINPIDNQPVAVKEYSLVKGAVTLKLTATIDMNLLVGTEIVIEDRIFSRVVDASTGGRTQTSEGGTLTITAGGDYGTVVIALNRSGLQGFVQGDYVIMQDLNVNITDKKPTNAETVEVISILGSAGGQVPLHTHTNNGGGLAGGGLANFSSLT